MHIGWTMWLDAWWLMVESPTIGFYGNIYRKTGNHWKTLFWMKTFPAAWRILPGDARLAAPSRSKCCRWIRTIFESKRGRVSNDAKAMRQGLGSRDVAIAAIAAIVGTAAIAAAAIAALLFCTVVWRRPRGANEPRGLWTANSRCSEPSQQRTRPLSISSAAGHSSGGSRHNFLGERGKYR